MPALADRRRNQVPNGPRAVKKSFSIRADLYDALTEAAREEGHNNISRIVTSALIAYLARRYDPRAA